MFYSFVEEIEKCKGELEKQDLKVQQLSKIIAKRAEAIDRLNVTNMTLKAEIAALKKQITVVKKQCADLLQQQQQQQQQSQSESDEEQVQQQQVHSQSRRHNNTAAVARNGDGNGRSAGSANKRASSEDSEDDDEESDDSPPPPKNPIIRNRGSNQITTDDYNTTQKIPVSSKRGFSSQIRSDDYNHGRVSSVGDGFKSLQQHPQRQQPPLKRRQYYSEDQSDDDELDADDYNKNERRGRPLQQQHHRQQPQPQQRMSSHSSGNVQVLRKDQRAYSAETSFPPADNRISSVPLPNYYDTNPQQQSAPLQQRRQQLDKEVYLQGDGYYPAERNSAPSSRVSSMTQQHPQPQLQRAPMMPCNRQQNQQYEYNHPQRRDDHGAFQDKGIAQIQHHSSNYQQQGQVQVHRAESYQGVRYCYADEGRGNQVSMMTTADPRYNQRSAPLPLQQPAQLWYQNGNNTALLTQSLYYGPVVM